MSTAKAKAWSAIFMIVATCVFPACGSQTAVSFDAPNNQQGIPDITQPAVISGITPTSNDSPDTAGSSLPETGTGLTANDITGENGQYSETTVDNSKGPDRVDAVYFHRTQRCVTCLCFEERITCVVETYFKDELNSGKLTYRVVDLGDENNTDLAIQYGAISSQLFINSVKNDADHIEDIIDIWDWNCRGDKAGFDQKVRDVIQSRLKGES